MTWDDVPTDVRVWALLRTQAIASDGPTDLVAELLSAALDVHRTDDLHPHSEVRMEAHNRLAEAIYDYGKAVDE